MRPARADADNDQGLSSLMLGGTDGYLDSSRPRRQQRSCGQRAWRSCDGGRERPPWMQTAAPGSLPWI